MPAKGTKVQRTCRRCGKVFFVVPSVVAYGVGIYCSVPCKQNETAEELAARFWSKVDRSGGPDACWPYMGGRNRQGYGEFSIKRRTTRAHRVAYELTVGPIPAGNMIRHVVCDNPPCCNPAHLAPGTGVQNVRDMIGKQRNAVGVRHWKTRLSIDQVLAIRERAKTTGAGTIAKEFGVSKSQVHHIIKRRVWKDI